MDYYDKLYDPRRSMLCVKFENPGYHSATPSGAAVHPTRESLIYALALLQRDASGDAERASAIIRQTLFLQDTNPKSPTFGVWPWHAEEPIDQMPTPDLNWADFCGAQIVQMLIDHSSQLPSRLRRRMRKSLRRAAIAIRKRNVGPGYTNIAVLGGGVCAAAGELLGDASLLEYGRRRLQKVVQHTARHGGFSEYNSPPYCKVVIAECERTLHLVDDDATRKAAGAIRRRAWRTVAQSFHGATGQWAGPHSRNSRERLRASTVEFLSERIGIPLRPHPSMAGGKPRGYAVVSPLPCPKEFVSAFHRNFNPPRQLRRTFVRGRSKRDSIIGTTWLAKDVCFGSVNQSSLWTQRKPLIAYWRTHQDPAVVFRLRFLHEGKDFASMGVRTEQNGPKAVCSFHTMKNRGDWHRTLDRPTGGVFQARDLRVRFQLRGLGVKAKTIGKGIYTLSAGEYQVVLDTRPSLFDGKEVVWELGEDQQIVYLDGICHRGAQKTFDFDQSLEMDLVVALEVRPAAHGTMAFPGRPMGEKYSPRRPGKAIVHVFP